MNTKSPVIGASELARLDPAQVLIVDCRFNMAKPDEGHAQYLAGHIPGAMYAGLDADLSDLGKTGQGLGRHPLPDATDFGRVLARWGWRKEMPVVAYDAAGGAMAAARLWWMVRAVGGQAQVLDGGLDAWLADGHELATGEETRTASQVEVTFDERMLVTTKALKQGLADGSLLVVDVRGADRYQGKNETIDPVAGHIPGALNRPVAANLEDHAHWRAPDALKRGFTALIGAHPASQVVHSCGSGVFACQSLLSMELAGLPGSKLYAPSFSGWISDPANPVATGAA